MSEYKRLVSYLYFYNKGAKSQNTGFIKAERRNGVIKLLVNLKGAVVPEEIMQVYFYVRREEALVGIRLGELRIRGGNGEFKTVCSETEIGVSFEELGGVYIKGGEMDSLFASQWDDSAFFVDKIVEMKDFVDKAEEEEAVQIMLEASEEEETKAVAEVAQEELYTEPKIWEMPIKEAIYVQELTNNDNISVCEGDVEEAANTVELMEEKAAAKADVKMEAENEPSQNPWDDLFTNRTQVDLFADDEIYDCVEIAPQDILKLPADARSIMSNSFLNHGFFNFHHLMLGRKYNADSENGLVLGVPGVYNRREKMTANMFGFEKFKFSMRSDVRMNHFGYWYREY